MDGRLQSFGKTKKIKLIFRILGITKSIFLNKIKIGVTDDILKGMREWYKIDLKK